MPNDSDCLGPMILSLLPDFVTFICKRLMNSGHQAYVVGGALRDACLGLPITDWDVATSATSMAIQGIFHDKRHFSLKEDTITLIDSGRQFHVTPFRTERGGLTGDLGHRDFTINAMAFDLDRDEISDPYGGRRDLSKRLIRAVRDPAKRFQEDPLRLLRAVRISAQLRFRVEAATLKTITRMAFLLESVAPERIREELIKILMSPIPSVGFNLMVRTGLLRHFLPELLEGYRRRQNSYHRHTIFKHIMMTVDAVKSDPVLRLTALLHDIAKPRVRKKAEGQWRFHGHEKASGELAKEVMGRLRFDKKTTGEVVNLVRHHVIGYNSHWTDAAVRRLIRRVGTAQIEDLLIFRRSDLLAHGQADCHSGLLSELEARVNAQIQKSFPIKKEDLAIDGVTVMEVLGLSPGPEVGRILNELNEKVLEHPELNNPEELEALLLRLKTH
ncbi:MAG: HD domain-containing protein [Desulfobacteraceae bacterium]|nr:HD domain-containing protein [Desulfobacteraceae bacterium]